jgi:hypothetical protein
VLVTQFLAYNLELDSLALELDGSDLEIDLERVSLGLKQRGEMRKEWQTCLSLRRLKLATYTDSRYVALCVGIVGESE